MQENIKQFYTEGLEELRKNRASGTDRAHGGEAARKRGSRNRIHKLENANWDSQDVTVTKIHRIGVAKRESSDQYCSWSQQQ